MHTHYEWTFSPQKANGKKPQSQSLQLIAKVQNAAEVANLIPVHSCLLLGEKQMLLCQVHLFKIFTVCNPHLAGGPFP